MSIDTKRLRELAEEAEEARRLHGWIVPTSLYAFHSAADPQTVLALLDEIERLRGEGDWEYQGVPIYEDGSEAVGRSIEACREWIESDADPNHWIHDEHNYDLPAVVSYRVERRRKAGPWEPVEGDHR